MASALTHIPEAVLFQYFADIFAGKHSHLTQQRPPSELQIHHRATSPGFRFLKLIQKKSSIASIRLFFASSIVSPWLAMSNSGQSDTYPSPSFSITAVKERFMLIKTLSTSKNVSGMSQQMQQQHDGKHHDQCQRKPLCLHDGHPEPAAEELQVFQMIPVPAVAAAAVGDPFVE